jgi:hypothetical protein
MPALVCVALLAAEVVSAAGQLGARTFAAAPAVREWLRADDVVIAYVQVAPASGLEGAALRVTERHRTRDIALDGTRTGARARSVSAVRWLPAFRRVAVHLDREHDASGLLIVDLATDTVVDAVIGRDLTPSPDGRYWAFEEHASRTMSQWPHTETVYAVYDAAAPPEANARACPTSDDRCRGQVLFLPDRLTLCHEIARARAGTCLTTDRPPRHARRSPFVWLDHDEVAWVDVDLDRQVATLVIATLVGGAPADVRAVPIERARIVEDVEFPPVREAWTIERITRDANPSRVWLHFRTRVPQAPLQRLGVRIS